MSDQELQVVRREAALGDPWARYRERCLLVRLGRWQEAGIEVGDRVKVVG